MQVDAVDAGSSRAQAERACHPGQSGFGSRQPHSKWVEPDAGAM